MKGLNKLALATVIAAAPFAAQAELKAMNDGAMGDVTGQAGVTIELETKVDIGAVTYTDEGNFAMQGVHIGGKADPASDESGVTKDADGNVTGVSGLLDDLKIDIDVESDGDAVIHVGSISGNPIDFAVGIETTSLNAADGSESTLLASNIAIDGQLAALDIRVDTATDTLIAGVAFNITNMDMDVDFLGVGIRGMSVTGASTFGADYTGSNETAIALGGKFAAATVTIGKAEKISGSTSGEALEIGIPEFMADINIQETLIGGENIGTIAMDNLAVTQTNLKVYGHE